MKQSFFVCLLQVKPLHLPRISSFFARGRRKFELINEAAGARVCARGRVFFTFAVNKWILVPIFRGGLPSIHSVSDSVFFCLSRFHSTSTETVVAIEMMLVSKMPRGWGHQNYYLDCVSR